MCIEIKFGRGRSRLGSVEVNVQDLTQAPYVLIGSISPGQTAPGQSYLPSASSMNLRTLQSPTFNRFLWCI